MDPSDEPSPRLGTTSLSDYVDDLQLEISREDGKPVVVGHSMGGLLAQMLAARQLASALVLLAPAPPAGTVLFNATSAKFIQRQVRNWGFWRKPIRPSFEDAAYAFYHLMPVDRQKELYSRRVYESGRALFETTFWYLDKRRTANVDPTKVKCPVLVIGGKQDRIMPSPIVRKIAARYPQATYREYEGNAHSLLEEPGWEQIATFAADWIAALPA
jgi:pimeloyl-ACP methyl ester carboxylesterase